MTQKISSLHSFFAIFLLVSGSALAQDQVHGPKASASVIFPQPVVIFEEAVTEQWPADLSLVNAPMEAKQIEPGQCVRFVIYSNAAERDHLLSSATLRFELSFGGKEQTVAAELPVVMKRVKPEGGDFVTQALGVAGIKNPVTSMVSLAVSAAHWCAPVDVQDGKLAVAGTVALGSGKTVLLTPATVDVKTFESARKTPAFKDIQTLSSWLQTYHIAPDPAHLLNALRLVAAGPTTSSGYNIMAFFTAALSASPAASNDIMRHLPNESVATRLYSLSLLKIAGYDTQTLVVGLSEDEKARVNSLVLPDPYEFNPDRNLPNKMDMLWAEFFATGRMKPVKAIASMLAWREDYSAFERMRESGQRPKELTPSILRGVVYKTAGWSLGSLSRMDGVVADYVDEMKSSASTPAAVKAELVNLYTNPAFTDR